MKKFIYILSLVSIIYGAAAADVTVDVRNNIYIGKILKTGVQNIIIEKGKENALFAYSEIKGYAYDNAAVIVRSKNGVFEGRYLGATSDTLIIERGMSLQKISVSDIESIYPINRRMFVVREFGIINGAMLMGYGPLNSSLTNISQGALLSSVVYDMGVYFNLGMNINEKLMFYSGIGLHFMPNISTVMSVSNIKYGTLYVNSLRLEMPLSIAYRVIPRMSIGIGATSSIVVTSVFQNYDTTADIYNSYQNLGLMPDMTVRYGISGIALSLSVGYEIFSMDNGLKLYFKTGVVF